MWVFTGNVEEKSSLCPHIWSSWCWSGCASAHPAPALLSLSLPRLPALGADSTAQVQTFSSNAFKFWLSGGDSGRQLGNYLLSPRGADPPPAGREGNGSFLPAGEQRSPAGVEDRTDRSGHLRWSWGLAALSISSSSSSASLNAAGSGRWPNGISRDDDSCGEAFGAGGCSN